jgi:ketosteroid isomerase-like protein
MAEPDVRTDPSFLADFAAAWNAHDVERLMTFMADDCEFRTSAGPEACGARAVGRDAVRAAFAKVFDRIRDARWSNDRHVVAGDRGLSEWRLTGRAADGTAIDVDGVDVFTFLGGRIALKDSFLKTRTAARP